MVNDDVLLCSDWPMWSLCFWFYDFIQNFSNLTQATYFASLAACSCLANPNRTAAVSKLSSCLSLRCSRFSFASSSCRFLSLPNLASFSRRPRSRASFSSSNWDYKIKHERFKQGLLQSNGGDLRETDKSWCGILFERRKWWEILWEEREDGKKNDAGKKSTSKAKSYDIERERVRRRNKGWKGRGNCLKKGRGK